MKDTTRYIQAPVSHIRTTIACAAAMADREKEKKPREAIPRVRGARR